MTDTLLLKSMLLRKGLTVETASEKLGISRASMSYKVNNKREFMASEIKQLSDLLELTDSEVRQIFFTVNVDE